MLSCELVYGESFPLKVKMDCLPELCDASNSILELSIIVEWDGMDTLRTEVYVESIIL